MEWQRLSSHILLKMYRLFQDEYGHSNVKNVELYLRFICALNLTAIDRIHFSAFQVVSKCYEVHHMT